LPKTFFDAKEDLDALTSKAAEYVYSEAQPALWAVSLVDSGRYQEAIQFCQASTASSSKSDRPVLLTYWAIAIAKSLGAGPQALNLAEKAIALNPDYWVGYVDLINIKLVLGDEEGVWRLSEEVRKKAGGRPGRAPEVTYLDSDEVLWDVQAQLTSLLADAESAGGGTFTFGTGPGIAADEVLLHDPVAAEITLQTTKPDPADPTLAAGTHVVRGLLAADSGDSARAASEMEAFLAAYTNPAVVWTWSGFNCWGAPAEEAAGRPDKADAILKTGGTFVDCYRFRGDILEHRGDWAAAQKAYAEAVALAPDLPAGYYSWGIARKARRSYRRRSEANRCQQARPALGRSAQSVGRCTCEAGQTQRCACEIRRGSQIRAELERSQGNARGGGEEKIADWTAAKRSLAKHRKGQDRPQERIAGLRPPTGRTRPILAAARAEIAAIKQPFTA